MKLNMIIPVLTLLLIFFYIGCSSGSSSEVTFEITDPSGNVVQKNTTEYEFPPILKNSSIEKIFTIENTGNSILRLTGNPKVDIITSGTSAFTVIEQPEAIIKPNEKTTFKIEFAPTASQSFEATIEINSNNSDSGVFKFKIKGTGLEPGLNVKQDAVYIPNGVGSFDFGKIKVNEQSSKITFTIENSTSNDLNLTGTPKIEIAGADASMFLIDQTSVSTPITSFNNTTFSIIFSPALLGPKTAVISFANDDINKNPYTFTIQGTGVLPEINVKQGSKNILCGTGVYDFGNVNANSVSNDVTFTIENEGGFDLKLTGTPKIEITGTDAAMFTLNQITTNSSIAPGSYTNFKLKFNPTSPGQLSATISIANDDSNENPYTFTIKGTGVGPEINIKYNTTDILSGTGIFDFGRVLTSNTSPEITFTIENIGTSDLKLTSTPIISMSGTDAYMFTVNQSTTKSLITQGSSTTFTMKFSPTTPGHKSALVSIANNDTDENPYLFTVSGTTSNFDFNGDGYEDVIVGALYDDDGGSSSGCAFIFFGTDIPTTPIDASKADVKFIGEDIGDCFGVSVCSAGDVNADGFDDVIIGANEDDDGGFGSGCAFIFFGSYSPSPKIDAAIADIKIVGETARNYFGCSVSKAGDINNDGFDDVIVGADYNNNGGLESGSAYIFYGSTNPSPLINASNADVKLIGEDANNYFGNIVCNAGDLNDDGFSDVIAVALQYSDGSNIVGCAYLFYGSSNLSSTIDASNADVKFIGENTNDFFACSVSYAGDINNDGCDDVIIGAYGDDDKGLSSGSAFIFFGNSNLPNKIYSSNADIHLLGDSTEDYFGRSVSLAGDLNGDGISDIIIGADGDDDNGSSSGSVYVFFGSNNLTSTIYASGADVKISGEFAHNKFGFSISGAGDFNKDGFYDIVIGAIGCSDGGTTSGNAYIIWGDSNLLYKINAWNADVKFIGEDSADAFGFSVSGGK